MLRTAIAILLLTKSAIACDEGSSCPGPLDLGPPLPTQGDYMPSDIDAPPARTSGGTYVQSGNIGNWYGDNGSHCVSTNFNGIVNVSCF